jgi:two-component system sensor histidine kinase/response regulator
MTAHAMKGDRERCLNGGMDGYVSKPLQWFDVETEIGRLGIPALPAPDRGALWERLMARGDGDKDFVRSLLRTFLEASPRLVAEVSGAVNADDCSALQTAIHKLEGACLNLLPDYDWHPLIRLQEMAHKGMLMNAHEHVVALNKEMNKLLQELTIFLGELEE